MTIWINGVDKWCLSDRNGRKCEDILKYFVKITNHGSVRAAGICLILILNQNGQSCFGKQNQTYLSMGLLWHDKYENSDLHKFLIKTWAPCLCVTNWAIMCCHLCQVTLHMFISYLFNQNYCQGLRSLLIMKEEKVKQSTAQS